MSLTYTPQETFNRVAQHLLTQGKRCSVFTKDLDGEDNEQCKYRHPDDPTLMCAAGCLIPDDKYDPKMESNHVSSGMLSEAMAGHHMPLLEHLQRLHDLTVPKVWGKELIDVAKVHGLNYDVVTNFQPAT